MCNSLHFCSRLDTVALRDLRESASSGRFEGGNVVVGDATAIDIGAVCMQTLVHEHVYACTRKKMGCMPQRWAHTCMHMYFDCG